jgi:hypothetical protein
MMIRKQGQRMGLGNRNGDYWDVCGLLKVDASFVTERSE